MRRTRQARQDCRAGNPLYVNDAEALELITSVVRDVLDDDAIVLSPASMPADVKGWDSVAHVSIVVSLERKLRRAFTTEQIESLQSVGDLVRVAQTVRVE
jgi:acyl carrier protein